MLKKLPWLPFALLGLALAFVVVSLMVLLSHGSNTWVRRKLRLGALLLSLSSLGAAGSACSKPVLCYSQAMVPAFWATTGARKYHSGATLRLDLRREVRGAVRSDVKGPLSWALWQNNKQLAQGKVVPADVSGKKARPFLIRLPQNTPPNGAVLYLFRCRPTEQRVATNANWKTMFKIVVTIGKQ